MCLWSTDFDRGAKTIQWGKYRFFQQVVKAQLNSHIKSMNLDPYFTLYIKINPKCIKGLNVRVNMIKLLEESIDTNISDPRLGNSFLNMTPKTQAKKKIFKLESKIFVHQWALLRKWNDSLHSRRNYLQIVSLIKDSYPEGIKELLSKNNKQFNLKMGKGLE